MTGPALNTDPRDPVAEELHLMKTAGIVEVASRNPNVMDAIKHWEDRALKAEAAVAAARAEGVRVASSLAAAISLLERGGEAAKKAAASDKMFDQMLADYRKSLADFRAAYKAAEASK